MSITWNGTASDSLGIVVEKYPSLDRPRRKADIFSIPGRSGDVVVQYDAFDNYTQPYEIFAGGDTDGNAETAFVDVATWLYQDGYCQLEDSSEPGYYRMAYYNGPMNVKNLMTRYGRCTVQFVCMPFRYMTSVSDITLTSSGTVTNPCDFASCPLLKIEGDGEFEINGSVVTVSPHSHAYLYLDCDSQQAYFDAETPMGEYVGIDGEFPKLLPGANTITITDASISKITISPRWRTL